tara:strand:+ start:321 stop:452 length:132 start_codon:yes stop_codon:yes gene_type:complete
MVHLQFTTQVAVVVEHKQMTKQIQAVKVVVLKVQVNQEQVKLQ